jgi:hypothetical protein
MPQYGFPPDDYTPHGYLANPHAVAHSWSDGEGGCLRSSRSHLGVGWQLPWALKAQASADFVVALECGEERLVTRADFASCGLFSPHHSSQLLTYRWQAFGYTWDASYVQVDPNALGVQVVCSVLPGSIPVPRPLRLTIGLVGWRRADAGESPVAADHRVDLGHPHGTVELVGDVGVGEWADGSSFLFSLPSPMPAPQLATEASQVAVALTVQLEDAAGATICAVARRVPNASVAPGPPATGVVGQAIARARSADAAFWSKAARLVGDWPDHWRRGWVYDLETTRMCIYPAGGAFTDVWPAWMIQWPRAVVAEGTLDAARLAYADPGLALRAALSLFRDTTADNVPCIFQHGEPNMVAKDGSICGTSPAWCVPFYNLALLYLRTLDRDWLAAIYPHLARYVEWWLRERTDAEGWAVYKCTWEAGEDDTPRLDPARRGDNVVSEYVRPVELQATMALSADVLARFATALDRPDDAARWKDVEAAYAERTRQLWDQSAGRFRDWDARRGAFLAPSAIGEKNYWGIDPCRYSALAFTPVLARLTDDLQRARLRDELEHYGGPPWTLWASWSYVVLEAAMRMGSGPWAGQIAAGIIDRVYRELDSREIAAPTHPTPGVAREYWPLALDSWASCEGYGWGANTATMLMRQVVGFHEGPDEDGNHLRPGALGWKASWLRFTLEPHLPNELLVPGQVYRVANLPYRGAQLDIGYRVEAASTLKRPALLTVQIGADVSSVCTTSLNGTASTTESSTRHTRQLRNGEELGVTLRAASVDPA